MMCKIWECYECVGQAFECPTPEMMWSRYADWREEQLRYLEWADEGEIMLLSSPETEAVLNAWDAILNDDEQMPTLETDWPDDPVVEKAPPERDAWLLAVQEYSSNDDEDESQRMALRLCELRKAVELVDGKIVVRKELLSSRAKGGKVVRQGDRLTIHLDTGLSKPREISAAVVNDEVHLDAKFVAWELVDARRGQRRKYQTPQPMSWMSSDDEDGDSLLESINAAVGEATPWEFNGEWYTVDELLQYAREVYSCGVKINGDGLTEDEREEIACLAKLVKSPQPDEEPSPLWVHHFQPVRNADNTLAQRVLEHALATTTINGRPSNTSYAGVRAAQCDEQTFVGWDLVIEARAQECLAEAILSQEAERESTLDEAQPQYDASAYHRLPELDKVLLRGAAIEGRGALRAQMAYTLLRIQSMPARASLARGIAQDLARRGLAVEEDVLNMEYVGLPRSVDFPSFGEDSAFNGYGDESLANAILWPEEQEESDAPTEPREPQEPLDINELVVFEGKRQWESRAYQEAAVKTILGGGSKMDVWEMGWAAYNRAQGWDERQVATYTRVLRATKSPGNAYKAAN